MTDRKDDVDMPDEIWVYGQPKDFGIKGHDDEYLAHSDPQIALKEHDVKYTRADKAEPAIDVEGLREDIIQHTSNRIACDQSVRESIEMCIGWAFDILASRNLIRTPREPIEELEEALVAVRQFYENSKNDNMNKLYEKTIYEAAKRYSEGS